MTPWTPDQVWAWLVLALMDIHHKKQTGGLL